MAEPTREAPNQKWEEDFSFLYNPG
jgi:hypothetical protein